MRGAFAGADLAENDDLDAAGQKLVVHLAHARQFAAKLLLLRIAATAELVDRLLDRRIASRYDSSSGS